MGHYELKPHLLQIRLGSHLPFPPIVLLQLPLPVQLTGQGFTTMPFPTYSLSTFHFLWCCRHWRLPRSLKLILVSVQSLPFAMRVLLQLILSQPLSFWVRAIPRCTKKRSLNRTQCWSPIIKVSFLAQLLSEYGGHSRPLYLLGCLVALVLLNYVVKS